MTRLDFGGATDVGRVRPANQDSYFTSPALFVVADGMGGHRGGEVASELSTKSLREQLVDTDTELSTDELVRAVQRANDAVVGAASQDPELAGMGTTLCALALVESQGDERLAIVNVGDSRVYLLKDGALEQITDDHSLVATLERQGRLTREEAAVHPQRNIVTRALGIDTRVMVDSWEVRPVPGDRYLLCSDGLFNEVEESRIAATLRKLASPDEAARELVRLANEGGGRDNITVVIVDVQGDAGDDAPADAAGAAGTDTDDRGEQGDPGPGPAWVDDRLISAVSGESRATSRADAPPPTPPTRKQRRASRRAAAGPRPRNFTWRVLAFVVAVAVIIGLTVAAISYYARDTYYVGFHGNTVAIFKGRPGGVLWIKPELVEPTSMSRDEVPASFQDEIAAGKLEPTLSDAHRYLTNVADVAVTQGSGGTSTSTSSTSSGGPGAGSTTTSSPTTTGA
jgi:PPM family protein phosphatase